MKPVKPMICAALLFTSIGSALASPASVVLFGVDEDDSAFSSDLLDQGFGLNFSSSSGANAAIALDVVGVIAAGFLVYELTDNTGHHHTTKSDNTTGTGGTTGNGTGTTTGTGGATPADPDTTSGGNGASTSGGNYPTDGTTGTTGATDSTTGSYTTGSYTTGGVTGTTTGSTTGSGSGSGSSAPGPMAGLIFVVGAVGLKTRLARKTRRDS